MIYSIAGIFGSGVYLVNWRFGFDTIKIKPPEHVQDSSNGALSPNLFQPNVGKLANILISKFSIQLLIST